MTKEVEVSKHAYKRLKGRTGLNKKAFNKLVNGAYKDGLTHKKAVGSLKSYYDSLYRSHKSANNIKIHKNYVFIFNNNFLVTIFPVRNGIGKLINNMKSDKK